MDNENKVVQWAVGFAEKWFKILITVFSISTIWAGSIIFGLSLAALIAGKFHNGLEAEIYLACSIFMMIVSPVVIYRTWSGKWPFLTRYLARRAAKERYKGDFI
ncbi:hypothetical protein [Ralstonia pseudosolanacearum]